MICYMYIDDDPVVICGDFNSRIGNKKDYCSAVDDVPDRIPLDMT